MNGEAGNQRAGAGVDAWTVALTAMALAAFAANSLLTRLALGGEQIDPASFTTVRLAVGGAVLWWLSGAGTRRLAAPRDLAGGVALFAYAAPFSFAYVRIGAGVGALVLFGAVQLTMIGYGIVRGERPSATSWLGLVLAAAGLALLASPSASRPDVLGLVLMVAAGIAWGAYSLIGRTAVDPVAANSRSFAPAAALSLLPFAAFPGSGDTSMDGILLALVCGGITTALGYVAWYRAVSRLSVMQAAVAQLSVPVIAAAAGVAFLHERITARGMVSAAAVLTGVALVLAERRAGQRRGSRTRLDA